MSSASSVPCQGQSGVSGSDVGREELEVNKTGVWRRYERP